MFGQQKNTTNDPNGGNQNPNGQNYFDVETIPIRTMKDDLAGTPLESVKPVIATASPIKTPFPPKNLPDQKVSPFFSENSSWDNKSVPEINKNIPIPTRVTTTKPEMPQPRIVPAPPVAAKPEPTSSENGSNWIMLGFSAVAVCFVLAILWFGYRYWNNSRNSEPISETPATEVEEIPSTPVLAYSEINPNYLRIENSMPQSEEAKQLLRKTAEKVYSENYTRPIEFIPTNQQNSPLSFSEFASAIGLNLPTSILDTLNGTFSLYLYNDKSGTNKSGLSKIGLSITTNNVLATKSALTQAELDLPDQLSPLFFTSEFRKDKNYGSSTYKTSEIRFINVISPEELSIDYTVTGNKLIIGTTRATIRSIIDKTTF